MSSYFSWLAVFNYLFIYSERSCISICDHVCIWWYGLLNYLCFFFFFYPVALAAVGETRGILVFSMNALSPVHPETDPKAYESQGSLFSLMPVRVRPVPHLLVHTLHHDCIRMMKSDTESMSLNPRPGISM